MKKGYIISFIVTALVTLRMCQLEPDPFMSIIIGAGVMGYIVWMGFTDTEAKAKSDAEFEAWLNEVK